MIRTISPPNASIRIPPIRAPAPGPDQHDRRDHHADLAAHAAQHDDRENDGGFDEGEALRLMKPWRVAKNDPAKPPNMAPIANAVSLVLVGLMPSDRQAISSSRSASQAGRSACGYAG